MMPDEAAGRCILCGAWTWIPKALRGIEVSILWGLFKLRVDFIDDLITFIMTPLGNLLDGLLALFGIQTGSVYLQMRTIDVLPPLMVR